MKLMFCRCYIFHNVQVPSACIAKIGCDEIHQKLLIID